MHARILSGRQFKASGLQKYIWRLKQIGRRLNSKNISQKGYVTNSPFVTHLLRELGANRALPNFLIVHFGAFEPFF
jgi:hypothetical protein